VTVTVGSLLLVFACHVTPIFAAFTVAIPVAVFLLILGLLNTRVKP